MWTAMNTNFHTIKKMSPLQNWWCLLSFKWTTLYTESNEESGYISDPFMYIICTSTNSCSIKHGRYNLKDLHCRHILI
jgi:hypothetical protein